MPSLPSLIGFAAGCIGLYSFVPQVLKCCRTSDTAAISLRMFALRSFGLLFGQHPRQLRPCCVGNGS